MLHIGAVFAVVLVKYITGIAEVNFLLLPLGLDDLQVEKPVSGEKVVDASTIEGTRKWMTGIIHRKWNTRATDETTFKSMSSLFFHSCLFPFMEMRDCGEPGRRNGSVYEDTVVQVLATLVELEVDEGVRATRPVVVEAFADPAHAVSAPSPSAPDGLAVKSTGLLLTMQWSALMTKRV